MDKEVNHMADREQIDQLIRRLSERMGTPESEIRSAVSGSDYGRLLSRLDPAQAKQVQAILADEQKAKELLSSPQAKAILKRLMG